MQYPFCHKKTLKNILLSLILLSIVWIHPSFSNDRLVCTEIAREVELQNGLPDSILTSISFVEAGRKFRDGSVKPWPWSLNHAGKSIFFESKSGAIEYLKNNINANFKDGILSIEIPKIEPEKPKKNFVKIS